MHTDMRYSFHNLISDSKADSLFAWAEYRAGMEEKGSKNKFESERMGAE